METGSKEEEGEDDDDDTETVKLGSRDVVEVPGVMEMWSTDKASTEEEGTVLVVCVLPTLYLYFYVLSLLLKRPFTVFVYSGSFYRNDPYLL